MCYNGVMNLHYALQFEIMLSLKKKRNISLTNAKAEIGIDTHINTSLYI